MHKAKDLIGKQIVKQNTGEQLATVRDLILSSDARNIAALIVDSGGWFRDTRVIAWEAITNIGDVILVTGDSPIVKASEAPSLQNEIKHDVRLTGLPIMNDNGERVGTVGDLYIDDAGTVIGYQVKQGVFSGNKFLFADSVQTVGRDAVLAESGALTSVKEAEKQIGQRGHAASTDRSSDDYGAKPHAEVATPSALFATGESASESTSGTVAAERGGERRAAGDDANAI